MILASNQGVPYYQFETLKFPGLVQAVATRRGGLSPPPWDSLNLGGTVGDDQDRVAANLNILTSSLGFRVDQLAQVRQVHSSDVILVNQPDDAIQAGDGMITNTPGILLLMRYADCVPLLFFDPERQAVGIAHAGWKGTLKEMAYAVIQAMRQAFGSNPENIIAAIGPSIGPDHYPVGPEVESLARQRFPEHQDQILVRDDHGVKLDLWLANQLSLRKAGVRQIELAGICTACRTEDFFSHRADGPRTGRFGAAVGLLKK